MNYICGDLEDPRHVVLGRLSSACSRFVKINTGILCFLDVVEEGFPQFLWGNKNQARKGIRMEVQVAILILSVLATT